MSQLNFSSFIPLKVRLSYAVTLNKVISNFDVLLTVQLSIFTLVINQLYAQILFYNKFISCLYMFRVASKRKEYQEYFLGVKAAGA